MVSSRSAHMTSSNSSSQPTGLYQSSVHLLPAGLFSIWRPTVLIGGILSEVCQMLLTLNELRS